MLHGSEALQYKIQLHSIRQPLTVDTKEINPLMDQMILLVASQTAAKGALPTGSTAPAQLSH